eukprot:1285107-Pleurochrysis_carterae.AAC.2
MGTDERARARTIRTVGHAFKKGGASEVDSAQRVCLGRRERIGRGSARSRRVKGASACRADGVGGPDVQRQETQTRGAAPSRAIRRGSGVASGPPAR